MIRPLLIPPPLLRELTSPQVKVYVALAQRGGLCEGVVSLAGDCGLGPRRVSDILRALEDRGEVRIERRRGRASLIELRHDNHPGRYGRETPTQDSPEAQRCAAGDAAEVAPGAPLQAGVIQGRGGDEPSRRVEGPALGTVAETVRPWMVGVGGAAGVPAAALQGDGQVAGSSPAGPTNEQALTTGRLIDILTEHSGGRFRATYQPRGRERRDVLAESLTRGLPKHLWDNLGGALLALQQAGTPVGEEDALHLARWFAQGGWGFARVVTPQMLVGRPGLHDALTQASGWNGEPPRRPGDEDLLMGSPELQAAWEGRR